MKTGEERGALVEAWVEPEAGCPELPWQVLEVWRTRSCVNVLLFGDISPSGFETGAAWFALGIAIHLAHSVVGF